MKSRRSVFNALLDLRYLVVVLIVGVITLSLTASALMQDKSSQNTTSQDLTANFWQEISKDEALAIERRVEIEATEFRAFTLDSEALRSRLANAPMEFTSDARDGTFILSLPSPGKGFERFVVQESPVMEQGLADQHPDIKTYSGQGIDDPGATIRFDQTPLGFHASIRGSSGSWYIDPRFHLDQSLYVSYFGRDLTNRHGPLVEGDIEASIAADKDFGVDTTDLAVGDQLRTYRLALLTDPAYAAYFGGPANVTAAKVTLINRVTQVYEYDLSIRLVLIANNNLLNLDTAAQFSGANGPCGGSACYSTASVSCSSGTLTRTRLVIGMLVGAAAFDIGHIAVGAGGGGIASLGVVGGNSKAQGCTGLPTPVGDLFAVDYVAHEMGHQFAGNHTFNGTVGSCSGGNRSAATSVEPGSGSSIMAYAGICSTDNTQPHSDPYFSQRSFDEITTYTSGAETNINEVQYAALTGFNTNGQQFQLRYVGIDSAAIVRGTNFTTAGIKAAIEAIPGWPAGGTVTVSTLGDTAFTITFGGTLAGTNANQLSLLNCTGGCTGFVGEIAKGGPTTRGGIVTGTGNSIPTVSAPADVTIPLRTPFSLTAGGTDGDGDTLTYLWEQNDRGAASGTALFTGTKTNGPLFRQFGIAANVTPANALLYNSPGQNLVATSPTRVFPDLNQILANQTNAQTGACPASDIICFSEFLPTVDYVGFAGVNAAPLSINFRVTVRDGRGGVNSANTTLLIDNTAGPLLVTSQSTAVSYQAWTTQTVTWDANNTASALLAPNVKISLSADGGNTYPYVLAASTPNDGSQAVTMPNVGTTTARIKIEAVGNIFFDISDVNFTITPSAAVGFRAPFDYDGDDKTDLSVFRPGPGEWWYLKSSNGGNAAAAFGSSTDKIVPADYTGDGKTDFAFFRASTGQWFVLRSEDFSFFAFPFGNNTDNVIPADFDGDGKADSAVFRPSTLTWFINKSTGGTDITVFGAPGDKPAVGDYDGDGKADIAIFRPSLGQWWIRRSSTGVVFAAAFGTSTDKPVQGDFTGDGKTDMAFWRPSTGEWFVLRSEDFSFYAFPFGTSTDTPVAGDYDGDNKMDAGVFRPSNNTWYVNRSTAGVLIQTFGIAGDIATPSAYVP